MKQNITILGSTGSIGTNTLDVLRRLPGARAAQLQATSTMALVDLVDGLHQPRSVGRLGIARVARQIQRHLLARGRLQTHQHHARFGIQKTRLVNLV